MFSARRLAAATLTAAITVTALTTLPADATPPAHAASHNKANHGKAHGTKDRSKGKGKNKPAKASKADKFAERAITKVTNTARVLDNLLRNAGRDDRLHGLSETSITAVRANLTADHNALVALVESVKADPSTAGTAYVTLRGYRTSNYAVAVGQARMAERLQARAADYAEYVETLSVEQQAAYDQALVHLNTALTSALAVKATSPSTALSVIGGEIRNALHQFSLVRSTGGYDDETDEPDTEQADDTDDDWGHDWDHHGHGRDGHYHHQWGHRA